MLSLEGPMKPLKNFLLVGLTLLAFTACQPAENDSNTQSSIGKETLTNQHHKRLLP